jgi:hypothetical protein
MRKRCCAGTPKLSLKRCIHTGGQLPDNHTCGALCQDFPQCLPPLPVYLPARLAELHSVNQAEHEQASAVEEALLLLHESISRGLTTKDGI